MTLVMSPRTSLALFVATALATRMLGGGTPPQETPRAPRAASAQPAAAEQSRAAQFAYSDQLRERLKTPVTPERGRNPFTFGSRRAARSSDVAVPAAPAPSPELPLMPPAPEFKLTGIAVSGQGDAAVLTAIMLDRGVMVFVKAGDQLSNGMTVQRVEEMTVTLVDATGATQTLRLP
jgi:biotin carboxyl carrier protein